MRVWPFRFRQVVSPGLRERTGAYSVTSGVFRITRYVDPNLSTELLDVQRFVLLHEEAHAVGRHGLLWALLFPIRHVLEPVLEAVADRYATRRLGPRRAGDAIRRLMPHARSREEARLYGATWKARATRAGAA